MTERTALRRRFRRAGRNARTAFGRWCSVRAVVIAAAAMGPALPATDTLSYTVSWLGLPVVDLTIAGEASDSAWVVVYRTRTRRWFERIYSVDNRYRIAVDSASGYPLRYEKDIRERRRGRHFWAQYDSTTRLVTYANGLQRPFPVGTHSLFSALVWIQRHPWELDEERPLLVEIEGVTWQVDVRCTAVASSSRTHGPLVKVEVRFGAQVSGEPVLSTTDILTRMLPGEGHQLRFGVDPERQVVKWVEFGPRPFPIRAKLSQPRERP